jgi:predicted RNA-binding protein YlxR (DUF448 family)
VNLLAESATVRREILRRCAVTREQRPARQLLRFVADADGAVHFDIKRKLPGRGVWVTASRPVVAEAVRRKAFQRALRRNVSVPGNLPELVEDALLGAALSALSLANKAGQVVTGFAKVSAALDRKKVTALVHANEAAADGCRKLDAKFSALLGGNNREAARIFRLPLAGISRATGRENVNHAALLHGGASDSFVAAAAWLCQFTRDGTAEHVDPSAGETSAGQTGSATQDIE